MCTWRRCTPVPTCWSCIRARRSTASSSWSITFAPTWQAELRLHALPVIGAPAASRWRPRRRRAAAPSGSSCRRSTAAWRACRDAACVPTGSRPRSRSTAARRRSCCAGCSNTTRRRRARIELRAPRSSSPTGCERLVPARLQRASSARRPRSVRFTCAGASPLATAADAGGLASLDRGPAPGPAAGPRRVPARPARAQRW
jgi:hypothetical protein